MPTVNSVLHTFEFARRLDITLSNFITKTNNNKEVMDMFMARILVMVSWIWIRTYFQVHQGVCIKYL